MKYQTRGINKEEKLNELGFYNPVPEPPTSDAQFPPKPRATADGFPYDANTLYITDPHIKGRRRPLLQSYDPKDKSDKNEPGGAYGLGTFQKSTPSPNSNSMPDGGSTWSTVGVAGWSRSLPNKEFDMPEGRKK